MNQNIVFREASEEFLALSSDPMASDFSCDLQHQINELTRPCISEEERKR